MPVTCKNTLNTLAASARVMAPVAFLAVHASWDRTALRINLPIDPERRLSVNALHVFLNDAHCPHRHAFLSFQK